MIAEQRYICSLIDIAQAKHFEANLVMAKKALDREVDRQTQELQKANKTNCKKAMSASGHCLSSPETP